MKLNIGENIRKHRRDMNLTQEQFAEKIGVSFQAVSRWENGVTYPDMELLPAISKFFDISVDQLLGYSEDQREDKAKETVNELRAETRKEQPDKEKMISLIRDIRNNYLDTNAFYFFWFVKLDTYCQPEILPEVRLTVEKVLEGNYPQYIKSHTVEYFSTIENDENIKGFLDKYSTESDTSRATLLRKRYRAKCDWEKAEHARQIHLMNIFGMDLVGTTQCWRSMTDPYNVDETVKTGETMLELLHKLNDCRPDPAHPVSGNGELDFWVENRITAGLVLSCALGMKGRKSEAFNVLEDTVSLIEKAMSITESAVLKCSSPWLNEMEWTAQRMPANEDISDHIWLNHESGVTCFVEPNIYYNILVNCRGYDERFKWFSSLKDDPHYDECIQRLHKLVK